MCLRRLIFVLPLVAATCFVAVLNGNVLCMAGGDHIAVESAHRGHCAAAAGEAGHDEAAPHGDECSDVSANLDLLRAGNRSAVETHTLFAPLPWTLDVPASLASTDPSVLPLRHSTGAPPASARKDVVESVVLII